MLCQCVLFCYTALCAWTVPGSLALRAKTSNGTGVGTKTEVVTSYGSSFDLTGKNPRLGQFFATAAPAAANEAVPVQGSPPVPAPVPKPKPALPAPSSAAVPAAPPVPKEPAPKPADIAPKAVPKTKPATGPPKPEAAVLPLEQLEKDFEGGHVLKEVDDPPCIFKLVKVAGEQFPRIMLKSLCATNRKFAKLQVLYMANSGKLVRNAKGQPEGTLMYTESLSASTYIVDIDSSMTVCTLKDLVSKSGATEASSLPGMIFNYSSA